jgi:protocatechuate 3,4-dioxygenase beta subunit
MDRRKFIGTGSAALAALALPKALRAQACRSKTEEDRYLDGPFHRDGAPNRVKLASEFEPGQRLIIAGQMMNCDGPMAGVNLDVWNATNTGCYESFGSCPAVPGHPEAYRLRGQLKTDKDGKYAFETILPGAYLNGSIYRPRHIHIIMTIPYLIVTPRKGETNQLVTQLYFEGDQYIPGDYAADHPSAANRIIKLDNSVPAMWKGSWNIVIPEPMTTSGLLAGTLLDQFDVHVRKEGGRMLFRLPPNTSNQPVEFRVYDGKGTLVRRTLETGTPIGWDTTSMGRGAYVAEFSWWTRHGLRKESVPVAI